MIFTSRVCEQIVSWLSYFVFGLLKSTTKIRRNTLQLPEKFFLKCLAPRIFAKHPDRSPAHPKIRGNTGYNNIQYMAVGHCEVGCI